MFVPDDAVPCSVSGFHIRELMVDSPSKAQARQVRVQSQTLKNLCRTGKQSACGPGYGMTETSEVGGISP
jgi:hypothetical protein